MKTYKFGKIDWVGIRSVLLHTFISALIVGAIAFIDSLMNVDFGHYSMIFGPILVMVSAFFKKLAETYSVAVPDTKVETNEETGPIAPDPSLE